MSDRHVPLAATTRSGAVESMHFGAVVAIDAGGDVAFAAGDPEVGIYPRSSLKPLQAAAMLDAGLDVDDVQLALVCASHDGTERHCEVVVSILARAGLDASHLRNAEGLPINDEAAAAYVRGGGRPSSLRMNCSGKHAGMLATCVANGWPVASYLDSEHPLQLRITDEIARRAGGVLHVGIDGCGAPTHLVALRELAVAFAGIAGDQGRIHHAMTTHPDLVGGDRRFVSLLMRAVPGLVAKDGAEGVFAAALPDGRAVALKIADGGQRAVPAVTLSALAMLGVEVDGTGMSPPILGGGVGVGEVIPLGDGVTDPAVTS